MPAARKRLKAEERGSALVEFALSFAFIFSVFAGVFQFGYTYYVYNNLETAVRGGARYASLCTYDSGTSSPSDAYASAVRNMVVYGNPSGGDNPVVPGLTPERVTVTPIFDKNVPSQVSVAINNHPIDAIFTTINLNGKPKAVFRYMGRYAPPTE